MLRPVLATLLALALVGGCSSSTGDRATDPGATGRSVTTAIADAPDGGVAALRAEIVERHPHDPGAYTQGLLVDDGVLYESTGQYGESDLRRVSIDDGVPTREVPLSPAYFGEGLALVDDRLIQLTWKEGVALVYDRGSLEEVDRYRYEGEGWGLCLDDDRLVMSDGSSTLTFRDPDTFEVVGHVEVTAAGAPVSSLNELECVDGDVYANVYQTDEIVVIDADDGRVTARIDASYLREDSGAPSSQVLNGIAHDDETGAFYLTGKYWSDLYEVRFVR